ncbi:MAG TPA: TIR domain-containing protein [Rhizomicrobium sp.]|nr:TIR domain-containing protein [Rhizomicrobium sp.]
MPDIFVSYSRTCEAEARLVTDALRALGYDVWRDVELPAHRAYAEVTETELDAAKAVLVIWSAEATRSQWVRSEADRGRTEGKLVQATIDGARLPMPFDQIQYADLSGWTGDPDAWGWRTLLTSIAELVGRTPVSPDNHATPLARRNLHAICVLPFVNMSGDSDQEYFSDGITEDIMTDLSKVSALSVVARNTAFAFKGKIINAQQLARQLKISHILEGSVRKSQNRVRITAQLIDAIAGHQIWAERWDRTLDDIFAVQDEISQAVVGAVRLKLLPEEKRAIERRATANPQAYDFFLMARQHYVSGNLGDVRREEAIIRLCGKAIELDPLYARAWSLMALAKASLYFRHGRQQEDGLAVAERALLLDPDLAEPHAVRARYLVEQGRSDEATTELGHALELDPKSYEVYLAAAYVNFRGRCFQEAIRYYDRAAALMEADYHSTGTMVTCCLAIEDAEGAMRAARMTLSRAERALELDKSNGSAMGFAVLALVVLGETERAKQWIDRAVLIDPENLNMRYNFACALCLNLNNADTVIDLLQPIFAAMTLHWLEHIKIDPDLAAIRPNPRFQALLAATELRLAGAGS